MWCVILFCEKECKDFQKNGAIYMEYKKKITVRLIIASFFTLVGLAMMIIGYFFRNVGWLVPLGSGFFSAGMFGVWYNRRTLKSEEKIKKQEIADNDERLIQIQKTVGWYTFRVMMAGLCIALVVFFCLNNEAVFRTLSLIMGGCWALYLLIYYIVSRKM